MKQVLAKIVKLFGGLYRSVSGPSNLGTSHFQSWQFLKPNLNPPQKKKREWLKEIEEPEPIAERLWSKEHFISFVVCVSSKKKMKVGGGVVYGGPRGTVLPTLLLGHGRARLRCYSSSPTPGMYYVQFGFEMWIHSLLFGKKKKKKEVLDSKFDICWHLGISFRPYNVHKGCGSDSASTAFVSPVKNA